MLDPDGETVHLVQTAIWKAYGTRAEGVETIDRLRRPLTDEVDWPWGGIAQQFEHGWIIVPNPDDPVHEVVVAPTGQSTLTFYYTDYLTTEECWDVTGDGVINVSDLVAASAHFLGVEGDQLYDPLYDVNEDGVINVSDLVLISRGEFPRVCPQDL